VVIKKHFDENAVKHGNGWHIIISHCYCLNTKRIKLQQVKIIVLYV